MDIGDLYAGLNALDAVRLQRNPDGSQAGLLVDAEPVVALQAAPYVWDDLRFPVHGINPVGLASDPTIDTVTYPGTMLFSSTLENIIAGVAQMPHDWALGTEIHPHVHWAKTTSAAGGVVWEYRYAVTDLSGVFGAYSAWEACTYPAGDDNTANKHALAAWSYSDMTGRKESAIILWQVRRNPAAAADTYAANARLLEFDIHYRKNKLGSAVELPI